MRENHVTGAWVPSLLRGLPPGAASRLLALALAPLARLSKRLRWCCKERAARVAALSAPRQMAGASYFFLDFFCLHFWIDVAVVLEPSVYVVVSELTHFFFLQRAIT